MPKPSNRLTSSLAAQTAELSMAVPQVVAHRVARMAMAGMVPSERDRAEFARMGDEKKDAFVESWSAMAVQAVRAQQAISMGVMRAFWAPLWGGRTSPSAMAGLVQGAALGVLGKGLEPVHRRAVANAKRLRSTSLR